MSHTSLPSQNGPIELIATRRTCSVLPTTPCSTPTPKSKPSSTKNPVHRTATMPNHRSGRVMSASSVGQSVGQRRCAAGGRLLVVRLELEPAPRVAQHEEHVDDAEQQVQQHERPETDRHLGGADRGGHTVGGGH